MKLYLSCNTAVNEILVNKMEYWMCSALTQRITEIEHIGAVRPFLPGIDLDFINYYTALRNAIKGFSYTVFASNYFMRNSITAARLFYYWDRTRIRYDTPRRTLNFIKRCYADLNNFRQRVLRLRDDPVMSVYGWSDAGSYPALLSSILIGLDGVGDLHFPGAPLPQHSTYAAIHLVEGTAMEINIERLSPVHTLSEVQCVEENRPTNVPHGPRKHKRF